MLDKETKKIIDNARDILVGKVPNPLSQIDLITTAMIYKFMDDMDLENIEMGGKRTFFINEYEQYAWSKLLSPTVGNYDRLNLYSEALDKLPYAKQIPQLFRNIFKDTFLPFRDGATLTLFLKEIQNLTYDHSENLGDAFEYLLSIMSSQGDAGQFRTPRHIIDFIVEVVNPTKTDSILDPACGTSGFLISAYKHILKQAKASKQPLSVDEFKTITQNIVGYDIDPTMQKLSLVNLYLHKFAEPKVYEYDTLTSENRWGDKFDVILANPPFMTPKGGIRPHNKFGIKASRAEVLFVDYFMEHLTLNGKAGFVVPEGIIFQSATAYKSLRKMMIEDNYLYAVVSLPAGIFNPYSGVKTSILFFDRELAKKTDKILFVDIKNDGYDLGAQRRPIKENDLPSALDAIKKYQKSYNLPDLVLPSNCLLVEKSKIAENGEYNLTASRYKQTQDLSNSKWEMVKLGDICELVRGITYSKGDEVESGKTIVLRANNISLNNHTLDLSDVKYLRDDVKLDNNKKLKKDDIFICLASGSKQHIGKVAYIENNTDMFFGGFMGAIRSKEQIKPKYLFLLLSDKTFNDYLSNSISGVNINNLNSKILYDYTIPLPPLEVQEEIVKELDGYQAIIDGAQKVVDNWKPTFTINPNWEKVKLGDFAELVNGRAYSQEELLDKGKYKVLRVGNFFSNRDWYYSDMELPDNKYCDNGDLLYAWSASFGPKIWDGEKVIYHYHIWKVIVSDKIDKKFLYYLLLEDSEKIKESGHGIAMMHTTKGDMENRFFPLPSLEEQKSLVAKIEQEEQCVDACKKLIELNKQKISDKIKSIWNSDD